MLALLALLQLQAATFDPSPDDSLPMVTLASALRRATALDPNYVAAVGQVDNARWARRSAFAVFLLPAVAVETDATKNIPQFFNFGTLKPESYAVSAQVALRYDLFTGGQKVAELTRSAAALDGAHAGELQARFVSALLTEASYYAVLAGTELPRLSLTGVGIAYDNRFYPTSAKFTQLTLTATLPIWDNFQRQNLISQARVNRDIFRAARDSAERSVQRDVVAAYDGFTTARATADFAGEQVQVARENYRVQQARYRTGATAILDLLKAQSDLDDASATLVQARYATRLVLAGLETILGRRLFPEPEPK